MIEKRKLLFLAVAMLLLYSCTTQNPGIISQGAMSVNSTAEITVLKQTDEVPPNTESLGLINIISNDINSKCSFNEVMEEAKRLALRQGGNMIKVTAHRPPDENYQCHRLSAEIFIIDNVEVAQPDSLFNIEEDAPYALIHLYRPGPTIRGFSYDVYLGEEKLAYIHPGAIQTVKVYSDGYNLLQARTEILTALPIKIEFGKQYYIRCDIKTGLYNLQPTIDFPNQLIAKAEFHRIRIQKINDLHRIYLASGTTILGRINFLTPRGYNITIFSEGGKRESFVEFVQISRIAKN